MEAHRGKEENFFKEILKASLIALIIVIPIRFYVAQPFIVSGASMSPTFESGHYLVVDQLSYRFREPDRGEVIIFKYPRDTSKFFIKRIVGLPGETLTLKARVLTITNSTNPDGFVFEEPYIAEANRVSGTFSVELNDNEYFVMGDNRGQSSDSRVWGPLQKDLIVGRAFLRIFPVKQADVLPGKYKSTLKESTI